MRLPYFQVKDIETLLSLLNRLLAKHCSTTVDFMQRLLNKCLWGRTPLRSYTIDQDIAVGGPDDE